MKTASCSHPVAFCGLLVALLLPPSSVFAEECKPKDAGKISGEGSNADAARDDFFDNAHSKCYELCKPLECVDAQKRCIHDGVTTSPEIVTPKQDRPRHFTVSAQVGCKCRCDTCDGDVERDRRKIVAHQQFDGGGDKPSEAEEAAVAKAKAWCQENECARFPCGGAKKCKVVSIDLRRVFPRPAGVARSTVGIVLLSCTCRCE
jgi:hypothetical protein